MTGSMTGAMTSPMTTATIAAWCTMPLIAKEFCLKPGEVHPGPCKGRGGKVKRAVRKAVARKAVAKPVPRPAPAPHQRVQGRDILAELDMDAIGALSKKDEQGRDLQLAAIARVQGFDGLPAVGTAQDLDALEDDYGIEVWRGVSHGRAASAEEIAEQFRTGPIHFGQGISGNGIYTGSSEDVALRYTSNHDGDGITRMVIHPDAQVIDLDELRDMMADEIPPDVRGRIKALGAYQREVFVPGGRPQDTVSRAMRAPRESLQSQDWIWMDPSAYAMAKGFDVVKQRYPRHNEYLILNRTAVMAQQADHLPRTLRDFFPEDYLTASSERPGSGPELKPQVALCMPPKTPVPKPGPCPGTKRGPRSIGNTAGNTVGRALKKAASRTSSRTSSRPPSPAARGPSRVSGPGPGTGRDLSAQLDFQGIDDLPKKDQHGADLRLAAVAKAQGFDSLPRTGDPAALEAAIAAGGMQLWRGVEPKHGLSAAQIHDQFVTGQAHFGQGLHGNGIYFTDELRVARHYARASADPRAIQRMVLPADARTISYTDLRSRMAADPSSRAPDKDTLTRKLLADLAAAKGDPRRTQAAWDSHQAGSEIKVPQSDPGLWAMAHGYDAVIVPVEQGNEVVLLNRGAALVEQAPSAPAPAPVLQPGSGPGTGRDLSAELHMPAIARLPRFDQRYADQRLAAVAKAQGFDAAPQLADEDTLARAVADGGIRLWRGVTGEHGLSAQQIHGQFTGGPARYGNGIYGNGIYFSDQRRVAQRYADFDDAAIQSVVLPAAARTISYPDLVARMGRDPSTVDFDHERKKSKLLADLRRSLDVEEMREAWEDYQGASLGSIPQADPGLWAMAHGFDAVIVPVKDGENEVVLLNRGAVLAEHPAREPVAPNRSAINAAASPHSSRILRDLYPDEQFSAPTGTGKAVDPAVVACLPPHVPVPKPGPCPGTRKDAISKIEKIVKKAVVKKAAVKKTAATKTVKPPIARKAVAPKAMPGAPGVGTDSSRLLDSPIVAALAKKDDQGADQRLAAIAREQGFDAPARLVSPQEIADEFMLGGVELWRAVKGNANQDARQINVNNAIGPVFFGQGRYGNGMYFTDAREYALEYGDNTPGSMQRAVLPAEARVIKYPDLVKAMVRERSQELSVHQAKAEKLLQRVARQKNLVGLILAWREYGASPEANMSPTDTIKNDPGAWAMAHGYDAIDVPSRLKGNNREIIVLNRGALLVEDPALADTAMLAVSLTQITPPVTALDVSAVVRACLPPHVPVPKPGPCPGSRRGIGKNVGKTLGRKTATKTAAAPSVRSRDPARPLPQIPASPAALAAPVQGRNLADDLDYDELRRLPPSVFGADRRLGAIAASQGFDGAPQVVSKEQMDQLVAEGNRELWRGVQGRAKRSGAQIQEQLRSGPAHFGRGRYGNGIYFTPYRDTASKYSPRTSSGIVRAVLHPDARTITWNELKKLVKPSLEAVRQREEAQKRLLGRFMSMPPGQYRQAWDEYERESRAWEDRFAQRDLTLADTSQWAMAHGYDAITLTEPATTANPEPEDQVILLNRTAMIIEEAAKKRRGPVSAAGALALAWSDPFAEDAEISACRPPHVPVPKPGPCPKRRRSGEVVKSGRKTRSARTRLDVGTRLDYRGLVRKMDSGDGGDHAMAEIARRQHFDAPPRKGTQSDLDKAVQAGGVEMWRTQRPYGDISADEMADRFFNGPADYGFGLWGSGWAASAGPRPPDDPRYPLLRMVMPRDADVIDLDDLVDRQNTQQRTAAVQQRRLLAALDAANGPTAREKALRALQDWTARQPDRDRILRDPGRFAAALGHDAIRIRRPGQPDRFVVLNRGNVLVGQVGQMPEPAPLARTAGAALDECRDELLRDKTSRKKRRAKPAAVTYREDNGQPAGVMAMVMAMLLAETAINACRPPHVPVPKPGPCPGTKRALKKAVDAIIKPSVPVKEPQGAKKTAVKQATKTVKAEPVKNSAPPPPSAPPASSSPAMLPLSDFPQAGKRTRSDITRWYGELNAAKWQTLSPETQHAAIELADSESIDNDNHHPAEVINSLKLGIPHVGLRRAKSMPPEVMFEHSADEVNKWYASLSEDDLRNLGDKWPTVNAVARSQATKGNPLPQQKLNALRQQMKANPGKGLVGRSPAIDQALARIVPPSAIGTPATGVTRRDFRWVNPARAAQIQADITRDSPWDRPQRIAIASYTDETYREVNGVQRFPDKPGDENDKLRYLERAAHIQDAMRPWPENTMAHRGTGTDQFGLELDPDDYDQIQQIIGKEFVDPGFGSTSIERSESFDYPVKVTFLIPKGAPAAYVEHISQASTERELLLAAGTRYRVLDADVIDLEEADPDDYDERPYTRYIDMTVLVIP